MENGNVAEIFGEKVFNLPTMKARKGSSAERDVPGRDPGRAYDPGSYLR